MGKLIRQESWSKNVSNRICILNKICTTTKSSLLNVSRTIFSLTTGVTHTSAIWTCPQMVGDNLTNYHGCTSLIESGASQQLLLLPIQFQSWYCSTTCAPLFDQSLTHPIIICSSCFRTAVTSAGSSSCQPLYPQKLPMQLLSTTSFSRLKILRLPKEEYLYLLLYFVLTYSKLVVLVKSQRF